MTTETSIISTGPGKREFRLEEEYQYNRRSAIRWIISHLLRYPYLPLIAFFAAVVSNFAYSTIQILVGRAFDLISTPGWATQALAALALGVFLAAVAQGATGLMRNYSTEIIANRVERDGRDELYVSLLGKSQTFHGQQRIGDIMARATNDVRQLNFMFSPGLMLILDSVMGILVPIFLISQVSIELLLVPALFLIAFGLALWDYTRQLNPVSMAQREQFGIMNSGLAETISGIEVVKGNVQEETAKEDFATDAALFRDYFVKQGEIQARYLPLLIFSVAFAAGFLHALLLWQDDQLTMGQVVTYMGLLGALRFPTFISIFSFNLVQLGIASADRILTTINTESELDENEAGASATIEGEVTFEKVSFGYNGAQVLQDLSFTARPGQTVAIVGQTGSGKTTLTQLINRIFDVDSGRVLVDDVDVRDWNMDSLRSQISTIEQDVFLFSRTLAENIAFGCPDATQEEIEQAAREAQAHDFIMSFSDGYQTEVGERGVTLSGGQRQRIAIARAFLTNPRILILDDSTSAIDSATEDQIQQAMRRISSQRTTFLITHRLSQIRWADQILVLKGGRLVDQGTHEELLDRSEAYQRIFARYD
ncbi:MAG TPA: ABC transporter ATP-binding protein [Anaerolineae bacterium]|jgi:ATP-binding cassette subfamily B protein|nr:ABC transporter ATP-binding protein [Anaerolineae bacterium]